MRAPTVPATEAQAYGWGGVRSVDRDPELARSAIGQPRSHHQRFVSTTMRIGLKIRTELGRTRYRTGTRVRDEEVVQGTPRFSAANFTVAVLP